MFLRNQQYRTGNHRLRFVQKSSDSPDSLDTNAFFEFNVCAQGEATTSASHKAGVGMDTACQSDSTHPIGLTASFRGAGDVGLRSGIGGLSQEVQGTLPTPCYGGHVHVGSRWGSGEQVTRQREQIGREHGCLHVACEGSLATPSTAPESERSL